MRKFPKKCHQCKSKEIIRVATIQKVIFFDKTEQLIAEFNQSLIECKVYCMYCKHEESIT